MKKEGFVIAKENGYLTVAAMRKSGCGGSCEACHGCAEVKPELIRVREQQDIAVGDRVYLVAESAALVSWTAVLYAIPLIFLIAGIAVGYQFFKSHGWTYYEGLAFLSGLIALAFSFVILRLLDRHIKKRGDLLSVQKIQKEED